MPRFARLLVIAVLVVGFAGQARGQPTRTRAPSKAKSSTARARSGSTAPKPKSSGLRSRLRALFRTKTRSRPATSKKDGDQHKKPAWSRIDAAKEQQSIAVIPHPSKPGQKMTLEPSHRSGGYHGASLSASQVQELFRKGLPGGGSSIDLLAHAEKSLGQASGFRGTTELVSDPVAGGGAAYWAGAGGYVVEIRKVPTWDVNALLSGRVKRGNRYGGNLMEGERELAVPRLIKPWQIKRVGKVVEDSLGRLRVDKWIENPSYGKQP